MFWVVLIIALAAIAAVIYLWKQKSAKSQVAPIQGVTDPSAAAEMRMLVDLHRQGAMTNDEYERQRQRILNRPQ